MEFEHMLKILASKEGSDLYLATYAPPCAKFQGQLKPLTKNPLKPGEVEAIANRIMDQEQQELFAHDLEMNLAITIPNCGRFRINIYKQRNEIAIVVRNIKVEIPRFEDLNLPDVLKEVIMNKRGLILLVGGTSSGKTTSLAALVDYRNRHSGGHIITIEDPVEYVHRHKKSIITQREVGVDTRNYHSALENTLKQAPDVILIGEIRDRDTMEFAINFSETGHLVISTLHANNANQALDRIVNFFPEERREQLLNDISNNLRAFISQRLVPTIDKKHCAVIEVLLGTYTIRRLIHKGEFHSIKEVMNKSESQGMQTFDSSLYQLVMDGTITEEDAIKYSDSPNNLRLKLKLSNKDSEESAEDDRASLSLEAMELVEDENPDDSADSLATPLVDTRTELDLEVDSSDEQDDDQSGDSNGDGEGGEGGEGGVDSDGGIEFKPGGS